MTFQILALDPAPFAPLFALSDFELAARNIVRHTCTETPGSPCRVSLADADVVDGETVAATLQRFFADPAVAHVDLHNAGPGCFAARAVRG